MKIEDQESTFLKHQLDQALRSKKEADKGVRFWQNNVRKWQHDIDLYIAELTRRGEQFHKTMDSLEKERKQE